MAKLSVHVSDDLWIPIKEAFPNLGPSKIIQEALALLADTPTFKRHQLANLKAKVKELEDDLNSTPTS